MVDNSILVDGLVVNSIIIHDDKAYLYFTSPKSLMALNDSNYGASHLVVKSSIDSVLELKRIFPHSRKCVTSKSSAVKKFIIDKVIAMHNGDCRIVIDPLKCKS